MGRVAGNTSSATTYQYVADSRCSQEIVAVQEFVSKME